MPSQEEMSRRESLSSPTSSAAFAWDIIRSKVYFGFCWSRGGHVYLEGPGDTEADGVELQEVTDALFQGRGWGQGGGSAQPASSCTGNSPCLLPAGSKTGQDSCS